MQARRARRIQLEAMPFDAYCSDGVRYLSTRIVVVILTGLWDVNKKKVFRSGQCCHSIVGEAVEIKLRHFDRRLQP